MADFSTVTLGLCLGGVDYTVRQLAVLVRLSQVPTDREHPERLFQALSKHLGISKPAMTRAVKRLVQAGMVKRTILSEDQRRFTVDLTDQGRAFIAANQFGPAPEPAPAWWVITARASDSPWLAGPFESSAKAVRWSDAARNFAGSSAARRVIQCTPTLEVLSPEDGTKRAKVWADTAPKPAAA